MKYKETFRKEVLDNINDDALHNAGIENPLLIAAARRGSALNLDALLLFAKFLNTNLSYLICLTDDSSPLDRYEISPEATRFNELRFEKKAKAVDIIKGTGLSSKTLTSLKKGEIPETPYPCRKYAEYFDVSIDYVLGLTLKKNWNEEYKTPSPGSVISLIVDGVSCYAVVTNKKKIYTTLGHELSMNEFEEKRISYVEVAK